MCEFCDTPDLYPGVVSCGDSAEFPAQVHPQRWNGWAVPYFDQDTAEAVAEWANGLAAQQWAVGEVVELFVWEGDTVWCAHYPDGPHGRCEYHRVPTWGRGRWYGIGARAWTWLESGHGH